MMREKKTKRPKNRNSQLAEKNFIDKLLEIGFND